MKNECRHPELLARCVEYADANGLKATTLGFKALNDGGFVADLRRGRNVRPEVQARIEAFMRDNAPASRKAGK